MRKKWILVGAVVVLLVLSGCLGGGGSEAPDNGTDEGATDGGSDTDGDGGGGTTGSDGGSGTAAQMASCNEGESYTETYTQPSPEGSGEEEVTVTVTVEGTENRDGTEYCAFSANYGESNMGMNQTFESFPELEDRTAEEIRWLVPTDSLDAGLNTSNENLIMEVYDTNGNIMLRWDFGSEEGMMGIGMTFYDEDGNEIDGMGGGQMPSGGEMPEGM